MTQGSFRFKSRATLITLEWPCIGMCDHVNSQFIFRLARVIALIAMKWPISTVFCHVSLQLAVCLKSVSAFVALEQLNMSMCSDFMLVTSLPCFERCVTLVAMMWPGGRMLTGNVNCQIRFCLRGVVTLHTREWALIGVTEQVHI